MSLNLSSLRAASVPGAREEAPAPASEDYPMPPPTQRGPPSKPPKLNLVNPASASPAVSAAPTPIMERRPDMLPSSRTGSQTAAAPLRVELLSTAFVVQDVQRLPQHLPNPEPAGPSDRIIRARCSQQLGVAADQITLYELRKLQEGTTIPDGCHHVGIMVQGNTFSLSALEDMLSRRKQDTQLAGTLDKAQSALLDQADRIAKLEAERAALQERAKAIEQENQHLREQLQKSDEHRHAMGETIRTLRREFEGVKQRLAEADPQLVPALAGLSLGMATPSSSAAPASTLSRAQ